ncbi:MAG: hypothetical protein LBB87_03180 [Nitrososphaerota archaeon]|jgi:hypothetical protein|nr:hypothetical protein [Nitrososphaerota archaeon]
MSDPELVLLKQISVLTKISEVEDQKTLRKLLIDGKAYSPQEGYVVATNTDSNLLADEPQVLNTDANVWETRTPKPKHKGDTPIPYEFCSYTKYAELPSDILHVTRDVSFTEWITHDGYKYKRIAGGVMRRPIN